MSLFAGNCPSGRLPSGLSPTRPPQPAALLLAAFVLAACGGGGGGELPLLGGGRPPETSGTPVAVHPGLSFHAIAPSYAHNCGIATDGRAWCWGYGLGGQLGDGGRANRHTPAPVARDVEFQFLRVSPTGNLACGLARDGTPHCWRSAPHGQLGLGESSGSLAVPTLVPGGQRFRAIAASSNSTCALALDGMAWCWGNNDYHQLGY